jgi:hypothetical protein
MISIVGKHCCWTFPLKKILSPFSRKIIKNRQIWRKFVKFRFHDYRPIVHFCFRGNQLHFRSTKIIYIIFPFLQNNFFETVENAAYTYCNWGKGFAQMIIFSKYLPKLYVRQICLAKRAISFKIAVKGKDNIFLLSQKFSTVFCGVSLECKMTFVLTLFHTEHIAHIVIRRRRRHNLIGRF